MRDTAYVRRRAAGIAAQAEGAVQAIRILILDNKIGVEDGLLVTEMLHSIREAALQIEVKESNK